MRPVSCDSSGGVLAKLIPSEAQINNYKSNPAPASAGDASMAKVAVGNSEISTQIDGRLREAFWY